MALNQEKARLDATAPPAKHLVGVRLGADGIGGARLRRTSDGKLWPGSVELDYVGLVQ